MKGRQAKRAKNADKVRTQLWMNAMYAREPSVAGRGPIPWGSFEYSMEGLTLALLAERHHLDCLAPPTSCEWVVRNHFYIDRPREPNGFVVVSDDTIVAIGKAIARRFAKEPMLHMDCIMVSDMSCQYRVWDHGAIQRRCCRSSVLPLLSGRVVQGVPRDIRVMLAKYVWEQRGHRDWLLDMNEEPTGAADEGKDDEWKQGKSEFWAALERLNLP
jgi:hypothetical protein